MNSSDTKHNLCVKEDNLDSISAQECVEICVSKARIIRQLTYAMVTKQIEKCQKKSGDDDGGNLR